MNPDRLAEIIKNASTPTPPLDEEALDRERNAKFKNLFDVIDTLKTRINFPLIVQATSRVTETQPSFTQRTNSSFGRATIEGQDVYNALWYSSNESWRFPLTGTDHIQIQIQASAPITHEGELQTPIVRVEISKGDFYQKPVPQANLMTPENFLEVAGTMVGEAIKAESLFKPAEMDWEYYRDAGGDD